MDLTKVTSEVKRMAELTALELSVPKSELDFEFNKYWSEVKDVLPPELIKAAQRGGYRQVTRERVVKAAGGPAEFFQAVLADLTAGYLDTQSRQALALVSAELVEGLEKYTVKAQVYLEPEVRWKKDVPGVQVPLRIKLPKEPEGLLERMVEDEINHAQEKSAVLVPCSAGTQVAEGHFITLSCESLIEGKRWEPGCFENKKWLVDRTLFRIPGMFDELLGLQAGDTKRILVVLNDNFAEEVRGKQVRIMAKISQVYMQDKPKVDDDLAKNFGFDTLEAFKVDLKQKCERELTEGRNRLRFVSIMTELMNSEVVEVDPIPYAWMASKAKELYGEGRKTVRTEEELLAAFSNQSLLGGDPVTNKETLLAFLAEKAAQSLIHDLIIRSWGVQRGIGSKDNQLLSTMPEYVTVVKEALVLAAEPEYYEVEREIANASV